MGKKKGKKAAANPTTDDYSRPGQGPTLGAFLDDGLTAQLGIEPSRAPQCADASASGGADVPASVARVGLLYAVRATKKGGAPVTAEPRRKGKKVVVIANCSGDLSALLKDLQGALGTGGVVAGNTVEIQGEQHLERVQAYLLGSGCLVGASKHVKEEIGAGASSLPDLVEQRVDKTDGNAYGLDSFVEVYGGTRLAPPEEWLIAKKLGDRGGVGGTGGVQNKINKATVLGPLDTKQIKGMKPPELKAQLSARSASIQGNKKELIARLLELSLES